MPAKGEKYNKIGVDLASWCDDYMHRHGLNQSEIARRLNINRGRVSQMLQGKINTTKYTKLAAINCEGGNYMALARYADADALRWLEDEQFYNSLKTKQAREEYQQLIREVRDSVKGGSSKDLLKLIKSVKKMTK